jgi:hypothetical protein
MSEPPRPFRDDVEVTAGPAAVRRESWGARARRLLFPDPPRQIPRHRALGLVLRTAHLMTFGALLGGHLFDVDPARLMPFLIATIASGLALMALEVASTGAWLLMGKGLAVVLKLGVLLMVPVFWEHRVPLLLLVVAIASVGSHMPARFRHRLVLSREGRRSAPRR